MRHRFLCDCGRPATVKLGSVWVCASCFAIDSARMERERQQRARQKRERRAMHRDWFELAESAEVFHSVAT